LLSLQFIRENPDVVRRAVHDRNVTAPIDRILALDAVRRDLTKQADDLKAERNALGRQVGQASPAERPALLERSRVLSEDINRLDAQLREVETELNALLLEVPNIPASDVPVAPDESGNVVVRTEGIPKEYDFEPKPHWELGESLGIIDFERGVKLAGSRFFILRDAGARLQRALIAFMLDLHTREHGYTELYLPYVLREENLVRSGHLPKFRDTMYHDAEEDFWFIPTAEASFANVHADEILEPDSLPIRYVSCTACFRREKASAGRDVRGIKRVHQFDKVEMFRFCLPEESEAHLQAMIGDAEDVLRSLGFTYRLLQLSTGDIDFKASKSFDLEIWAPGSHEWFEVSSASNCTDFQARRANVRFRRERAAPLEFPHMLNASGVALPRLVAGIIEAGQQADGSVVLPEPLRPFYGPDLVIRPPE
jgi:seryl-tRNA synthetase